MAYARITTFIGGLNTRTDERRLKPNSDTEGVAESPDLINMDITKTGSIITSTGFEEVSRIVGNGGVKNLLTYDKDTTDRFLMITHDDNHYSVNPSSFVWNDEGSYGTASDRVGGTVYLGSGGDRLAILGNDTVANTMQDFDGTTLAAVGGAPPDSYIMTTFMGRLFAANGHTLFYTNVDDQDDWAGGGSIGFNDIITGLSVSGERLTVLTRSYHQGVVFNYNDAFAISSPLKEPYERKYGNLAPKSVTRVYPDTFYWAQEGVMALGNEVNYTDGVPRPMSISRNIDLTIEMANMDVAEFACAEQFNQKYFLALPFRLDEVNSRTFVYDLNWNAWTVRDGFYPSDFALFKNSDLEEELYFSDSFSPTLYKFNDSYSYNDFGYVRRWRSKKFTHGDSNVYKEWKWLDIAGSMDENTEFFCTIEVDGVQKKYLIDKTYLEVNQTGDYLGDNILGDMYLGGDEAEDTRFKRFRTRIYFNSAIREGFEMQITLQNEEPEQPWKIDFLGIEYRHLARTQMAKQFLNNNPIPL